MPLLKMFPHCAISPLAVWGEAIKSQNTGSPTGVDGTTGKASVPILYTASETKDDTTVLSS